MNVLIDLWERVHPHLTGVGLVLTWLGIIIVYIRRRTAWRKKSFLNQVNFSLNYIENGQLCLRTLLELSATEVWLNDYGIKKVYNAAAKTRHDQPFIHLDDQEDMDFIKRAVLNVLSEKFAEAFLARSMNLPVRTAKYCFAITFENFPDMRTRKIRVLLMEAESLKQLGDPSEQDLAVAEVRHRDRLTVLRTMRDIYLGKQKWATPVIGEMELGVVARER
jgi:hypothetical protein